MAKSWQMLVFFILVSELAGVLGAVFTLDAIPSWYNTLAKPPLSPPPFVFAPVWTALYLLMGVSAYLIWEKGAEKKEVRTALLFFALQLALNALWSILFFGMRSPLLGLIDIVLLWLAIFQCMRLFYRIDKRAACLLIPYIVWVSFAAYLNAGIFIMNPAGSTI